MVGGIFAGEAMGYKLEGVGYGRSTRRLYAISSMKVASSTAPLLWSKVAQPRRSVFPTTDAGSTRVSPIQADLPFSLTLSAGVYSD